MSSLKVIESENYYLPSNKTSDGIIDYMIHKLPSEFLKRKRDFSPLLVHLTKDADGNGPPAEDILEIILQEKILRAYNHYCLFESNLEKADISVKEKFKVVCFTETPIDLIDVLLMDLEGRYRFKPKPFGLVFTKDFIRQHGGNPVFYVSSGLFDSLWKAYEDAKARNFDKDDNKFLALVNKCNDEMDFHWEREWRVVGDLKFDLSDVYCALCPEDRIVHFEHKFSELTFIGPNWGIYQIFDKLKKMLTIDDLPFRI